MVMFCLLAVCLASCTEDEFTYVRKSDKVVVVCKIEETFCGIKMTNCNDGATYLCMNNVHVMGEFKRD
jgi:hypothetical protein